MNLTRLIKREILITISSVMLITITFFGLSYAIYMTVDEENIGIIELGELSFTQVGNNNTIISGELYPMNETEGTSITPYSFVVTNNSEVNLVVTVYATRYMADSEISYNNIMLGSKLNTDQNYEIKNFNEQTINLKENILLAPNSSKTINVVLWGNEELENDIIGKEILAFINAVGYYYPDDPDENYGTYVANARVDWLTGKDIQNDTYEEWEVPVSGYYKIEAWGGSGGAYSTYTSGKGAYTSGIISLEKGEILYIYTGKSGTKAANSSIITLGSFGGGGAYYNSGTGGGSTDIRCFVSNNRCIKNNANLAWDDNTGLNSRIMVAAGGGGTGVFSATLIGGDAGALIGFDGANLNSSYLGGGHGGSQKSGGTYGVGNALGTVGTFGIGGTGGYQSSYSQGSGAGGSGYYGGGGGSARNGGGAGGSSYISGYAGVNSISLGSTSNPRSHTDSTRHYTNKFFLNGQMIAGNNIGNGKAKITYMGLNPIRTKETLNNVQYIKNCVVLGQEDLITWAEIQAIKNGVNLAKEKIILEYSTISNYARITDGISSNILNTEYASITSDNKCITINLGSVYSSIDEIAIWHANNEQIDSSITFVSADNLTWIPIISNSYYTETINGSRINAYN